MDITSHSQALPLQPKRPTLAGAIQRAEGVRALVIAIHEAEMFAEVPGELEYDRKHEHATSILAVVERELTELVGDLREAAVARGAGASVTDAAARRP